MVGNEAGSGKRRTPEAFGEIAVNSTRLKFHSFSNAGPRPTVWSPGFEARSRCSSRCASQATAEVPRNFFQFGGLCFPWETTQSVHWAGESMFSILSSLVSRARGWNACARAGPRVALIAYSMVAVLAYALAYMILAPIFGPGARALLMLFAIAAGWLGGMWAGLIVSLLTIPLDWAIIALVGVGPFITLTSIPFIGIRVIVGALVGRMHDLETRAGSELAERERIEELLRESETCYRCLFELNPHPMMVFENETDHFLAVNAAAIRHYGYSATDFKAITVADLFSPKGARDYRNDLEPRQPLLHDSSEWKHRKKDGTIIDVEIREHAVPFHGREAHLLLVDDISKRKKAQEELKYLALHDPLTGLPNRALLLEHIEQCVASARRNGTSFALILLDLDRFKEINDTLGHFVGDNVLQQLSPRFRSALRDSDVIARLGGDEFAVLLPETDERGALEASERLSRTLDEPFLFAGQTFVVGTSMGIAIHPQHGQDTESLLRLADIAMYRAKRSHCSTTV